VQVTATQLLFSGGGVHADIKGAELTRDAAVLEMKGVVNQALLDVRVQFYDVILAREKIKVQEENIHLLQQQLKDATARYQAGTASNFEKLRAEVALANAQVPLITARNDYRLSIEQLRQLMGLPTTSDGLRSPPEPVGSLEFTPAKYELQAALDAAHANRPELQRLAKLEAAREEGVTGARSGYYPNLALFGGYEVRKGATNNFGDSNDGFLVGVQSRWNIFDGRATAGRVAQARSLLTQTKLSRGEQSLAIDVEVRRAVSSLQEAMELAEASQKVVAQAEESLRLANARYGAGTSTQLDVLTSQVDLTTARTNQLQAYYTYNVALAALRKAMAAPDEFVAN
jgi:outer membrane protein TolC